MQSERKKRSRKKDFYVSDLVKKIISPIKKDKNFWAKEMALLKRLIEKYPNLDFWKKASLKQVPSFAIYLSTEDRYLFGKYQEFLFQPEIQNDGIKLGEKSGEDYHITKKPTSIKNFLK